MSENKVSIFDDGQITVNINKDNAGFVEFTRHDRTKNLVLPPGEEYIHYTIENRMINDIALDTDFERKKPTDDEYSLPVILTFKSCYVSEKIMKMMSLIPEIYGVNLFFEDCVNYTDED